MHPRRRTHPHPGWDYHLDHAHENGQYGVVSTRMVPPPGVVTAQVRTASPRRPAPIIRLSLTCRRNNVDDGR
jgi:hypothetical protein